MALDIVEFSKEQKKAVSIYKNGNILYSPYTLILVGILLSICGSIDEMRDYREWFLLAAVFITGFCAYFQWKIEGYVDGYGDVSSKIDSTPREY